MKPSTNNTPPQGYKMTELGALPEEWEVVRLGEYCKVFSGYAFKSDDFCNNGVLVVKIGNLQNGSIVFNTKESFFPREKINDDISKYILNEGDILIALTGATTGKISLVPKSVNGALLNQRVGKFSIYNDSLYKSFVMYYVMTDEFQNHIKKNILQSAQGNISPKQIETFSIPLPPLAEQQKIAAVLSAVQEAKEKTEAVIAATKALKKSMMKHLFTYGPVPPEETENVLLKETEIGKVPEEWEVVKLGEISNVKTSFPAFNSISELDTHKNDDEVVLALKVSDMNYFTNQKYINESQITFRYQKIKLNNSHFLRPGSIIFPKRGGAIATNKKRITKYYSILDPNLIGVEPSTKVIGEYLFGFFEQFDLRSLQDNTPIPQLNKHQVESIMFPLPPLPIQQKIASILTAIDAKIEAEENKKKALEELFKTLLHNLMTAKIRVDMQRINLKEHEL